MPPDVNTDDLVAATEVARILGLSRVSSVATYVGRYDDFPEPVVELSNGRIRLWLRQDIEAWDASRPKKRGPRAKD